MCRSAATEGEHYAYQQILIVSGCFGVMLGCLTGPALADPSALCKSLPGWTALKNALTNSILPANGGLGFNMWGTIVAADGTVCAVAFSGATYTSQWLGSRVISAQKASTGNDMSVGKGSVARRKRCPSTGLAHSHRQPLFGGAAGREVRWTATHPQPDHPVLPCAEVAYWG